MTECRRCGRELPKSRGNRPRVWCSEECRRQGPLPDAADGVADVDEVLRLLTAKARAGAVGAGDSVIKRLADRRRHGGADDNHRGRTRNANDRAGPDVTFKSWQGFASDRPEPGTVVSAGMLLRGDHPIVRAHPEHFLPADTPPEEISRMVDRGRFGGEAA